MTEAFPHDLMLTVVSGARPKICVRLSGGTYAACQTNETRYERWRVCEALVSQFIHVAERDGAAHSHQTLERLRASAVLPGIGRPVRVAHAALANATRLVRAA